MFDDRHSAGVSKMKLDIASCRLTRNRQLAPGSCYTADVKFIALSAGAQSVESVRVIDLATNETADIRDLPSIVAVEGEEGVDV